MDITRIEAGAWTGWWRVSHPTRHALSYIRYSIPKSHRNFVEHTWYVHEKYVDDLRQLQREGTPIQHNTNRVISDPYAVLHLRPTAPPAIIKAAWRELAKLLHPDHGGNPEEFQRAKEAYEILSKR